MLHEQAKNYLLIEKSAEIARREIGSLLDYDRGQCAKSSYLNDAWYKALDRSSSSLLHASGDFVYILTTDVSLMKSQ